MHLICVFKPHRPIFLPDVRSLKSPIWPEGQISVVYTTDSNGVRNIEVFHAKDASPVEVEIHNRVARELTSNQGLNGLAYRAVGSEHNYMPGTRGEEVHFEVAKHESLVSHYETAVAGGATDLEPRLEQLQLDLAVYQRVGSAIEASPTLANAEGLGHIDASPRFAANKLRVTAAEARAEFEPANGKFESFEEYKLAARAD